MQEERILMHSTIFVLNDNPISENDVIDDDYFSVSQIERRGYDYCGVTNLEYEARDYFSGYYSEFFQTEIMKTEYEDYPEDNFVQYKMTIANREKYMKNVYKRYRKALKSFSDVLTLERLLNGEDREISYLLYKLQCIMDDTCSIQFYSDYGDFESPEQLMRRSKDGDVYYIVAAFDYHF